jgi:hypothetical protein
MHLSYSKMNKSVCIKAFVHEVQCIGLILATLGLI